jgi:hypothetical protein
LYSSRLVQQLADRESRRFPDFTFGLTGRESYAHTHAHAH